MSDSYLNNLLSEREEILLATHQHWSLLIRNILFEILLIVGTIIGVTLIMLTWPRASLTWTGFFLLLIPLASLIKDMLVWQHHKYVVTNRRVIQIFGVFNKNVTDSSLEKVNDVKMDQSVIGRVFNFGDIEILTASELGINRFTFIGDPIRFKTAMLNAKHKLEEMERPQWASASNPVMDVPRLIEELDGLRKRGALSDTEFEEKKARLLARI